MITIRMPLVFGFLLLGYVAINMVIDIIEIYNTITKKERNIKMSEQKNQLLSRVTYKRVKNMDRAELSNYITQVYIKGYEAGCKSSTPDLLIRTFREVLLSIDSIGPTRADAIMKKLSDTFAIKEKGATTEESSEAPAEPEESTEVQKNA